MSEQVHSRTWQERLGGRYSISLLSYLTTSLLSFPFIAQLQGFGNLPGSDVVDWVAIYFIAIGINGCVVYFLHRTIFASRRERPVAAWIVIANNGFQGALFGTSLLIGSNILNLKHNFSAPLQIIFLTFVATWWGSTLPIFLDQRLENLQRRDELIHQAVLTESLSARQQESTKALNELMHGKIRAELSSAELEFKEKIDSIDWEGSSKLLLSAASTTVRPMSHEISRMKGLTYPRIRWWTLPINIIRNQPINVWLIIIVGLAAAAPQQVQQFGATRAFTLIAIVDLLIIVIGLSANRLMMRFKKLHATIFVGAALLLQISIPILVYFREKWVPGISGLGWQGLQLIGGFLLILLTSGFAAWGKINERLNANFQEDLKEKHIQAIASSQHIAKLAREASKILHGSVQTRLVACALAIDQAALAGDEVKLNEAILQAQQVLSAPLKEENFGETLIDEINRKASLWNEICEIDISIHGDKELSQDFIIQVGRVVEEAIANAIRHGRAKRISISSTFTDEGAISLEVIDDGTGPKGGSPSFGSALLDQASRGNWSLKGTTQGTELKVLIPH
jgi:signal transduction histidine kinase